MNIYPHLITEGFCNTYIVCSGDWNEALLIDPAGVDGELIDVIESHHVKLTSVLITHRHDNHTAGLRKLLKIYSPQIFAYHGEIQGIKTTMVRDDEVFEASGLEIKAIQVPGHSIDSLVYQIGNALFTGDTLHAGCIGSTKNNMEKSLLVHSLKQKIMCLNDNCLIYPGHGAISKLRIERMFNHDILESDATLLD
jgi:Zn-dependent hydrolases, including glyoxylases